MSRKTEAGLACTIGIDTGKNTLHLVGLARQARARPDCGTACECAALPNRHRGWHGDALCGPGAACARP